MKVGKVARLVVCGLVIFFLAACGAKSPEDLEKNVLKDSYTGYSQESGYEGLDFRAGGDTLTFDKSKKLIKNSHGEEIKYGVVPDDQVKKIPSKYRGALVDLEKELKETDNFTIAVGDSADTPEKAGAYYQVALQNGGKNIRVIELRRGYKYENAYYDFSGVAD
ncbi:hypothetical protein [Streptococcus danieliae]|uniref:Lipoprotein n=1 Tax=Streptococcus danieliae TaxID=747656 RepID=A0A7Z0M6F5_9STRE|nr:hypothetical protein [Streptococcus danieliae]MBF0699497.1 hypothetical protein [Streptococcus danieliae]NYS96673.1 hypothetical protein [Streptococcus danieliae]